MSGRRFDRAGAAGKTAWANGRGARRRGARQTAAQSAMPEARTLRASRHRRVDEACDQPAADGRLAGLWRGFRHRTLGWLGAEAAARSVRRYEWRKSCAKEPGRDD